MKEYKCPKCSEVSFEDMWILHDLMFTCDECGADHGGLECPNCHEIYDAINAWKELE